MKFNLPVAAGIVVAIILVGLAGITVGTPMTTDTTLMMVLPSMLVFGAIVFAIGVKHGEYRTTAR